MNVTVKYIVERKHLKSRVNKYFYRRKAVELIKNNNSVVNYTS